MALFVAVAWWLVTRFAGGWGIPYFSFTTDNGSSCTNTWGGYRCTQVTPADFAVYTGQPLPPGTTIVSATYVATHDYSLDAVLRTDAQQADAALKQLHSTYGECRNGPIPPELTDAKNVCRMANQDDTTDSGVPSPRIYSVTTGQAKDGQLITVVHIQSR